MNNRLSLLKQLIPGLLPLIVFIAVDEIWGTKEGLIVAMVIGAAELIYGFAKGQKPDKFILLDLGLIMGMGGVSLLLDNDFFFKLKPVIIGFIMAIMMGVAAYLPGNILLDMSKRYMKGIEIDPWQQWEFKKSLKVLFWLILTHTVVTLFISLYGSTRIWGLWSGPGFFVLFGIFMGIEFLRKKQQAKAYNDEEWLPIVHDDGNVIGRMPRSVAHSGSKLLHPVVHLHVFNNGKLYLQKRPMNKLVQPGKWDTAVGGHIASGETIEIAMEREAFEEIGLKDFKASLVSKYKWQSDIENELVFMFVSNHSGKLSPHTDEVDEGKYWSMSEIEAQLGTNTFTPNFEKEFELLRKL